MVITITTSWIPFSQCTIPYSHVAPNGIETSLSGMTDIVIGSTSRDKLRKYVSINKTIIDSDNGLSPFRCLNQCWFIANRSFKNKIWDKLEPKYNCNSREWKWKIHLRNACHCVSAAMGHEPAGFSKGLCKPMLINNDTKYIGQWFAIKYKVYVLKTCHM